MSDSTNTNTPDPAVTNQGEPPKTFTQEELTKIAAKESKSGEKKGLAAGLEQGKSETRAAMLAEMGFDEDSYKTYLEAKKNKETDSDRLTAANKLVTDLKSQLDTANNEHTATRQKLSAYEEREILGTMGITDVKKQKMYAATIREDLADGVMFTDAAEKFKEDNPELFEATEEKPKPPPGAIYGGQKQQNTKPDKTNLTAQLFGTR